MPVLKFFVAFRGGVFCLAWRTFVLPSKVVEHVNGFVAFPVNQLDFHVACQAPRSRAIPAFVRSYVGKDTETPSSSPDPSPARGYDEGLNRSCKCAQFFVSLKAFMPGFMPAGVHLGSKTVHFLLGFR